LDALGQGSDVICGSHAQAPSEPLQRSGRLSPQARARDADLAQIALAAALQVSSRNFRKSL
jgi:hypothetical protein